MREMILNHCSITAPDIRTATKTLADLAGGMAELIRSQHVNRTLRAVSELSEITVLNGVTLYDALVELRKQGSMEEFRLIVGLATKAPLLSDLASDVTDRFLGCESLELSPNDGGPLVLCAHIHGIGVSFPSNREWDSDRIAVRFAELLPNSAFQEATENIDNLSRSFHANAILSREIDQLQNKIDSGRLLWAVRSQAFPSLEFGPDVQDQIRDLGSSITTIVNRLAELNHAACGWRMSGGPAPIWGCKVSPESPSVEDNPALREARRFRSITGMRELFLWHARFGSGGRIHMRLDAPQRKVEIGYIGEHLPL